MNTKQRMTLLAALMASVGLVAAGCGDNRTDRTTTSMNTTTPPASTSVERAADKVAANTEAAANKATSAVGDATITASVKTALIAEPGLKALQIDVDTQNGVVTLSGTVDTPENKARAVQVAQGVTGVSSVKDNLSTKTTG
jgi:hyperosmotically inducible protein